MIFTYFTVEVFTSATFSFAAANPETLSLVLARQWFRIWTYIQISSYYCWASL